MKRIKKGELKSLHQIGHRGRVAISPVKKEARKLYVGGLLFVNHKEWRSYKYKTPLAVLISQPARKFKVNKYREGYVIKRVK